MKPLPKNDPYAFQARVMDALLRDIGEAKGFPRLDALRAVNREKSA